MALSLKKKLPIHPSFLLLFGWFVLTGDLAGFFIFVGVVITHELGLYFVEKKLGYRLDSFFLAPYGVSLNYTESVFEAGDEVKIALAGPLVNFSLSFVVFIDCEISSNSRKIVINFLFRIKRVNILKHFDIAFLNDIICEMLVF